MPAISETLPSENELQAQMADDPRLFSNQQAVPPPLPELQPPPQRAFTPQPRILPEEPRALTRSRSNTPAPKAVKLAPQAVPVQPAASSSSKGDEMRAILAILEGPERAKSEEPALVPQNPPIETPSAPKTMHVKKAKIIKALKAQDKKAETKEIVKKGMAEFFAKKPPAAKTRAKTVPPQQMPAMSFDEIAAELEQGSFLDNPVGLRKRDTRQREAEVMRSSASSSAQPESAQRSSSIAAVRPRSGSAAVRPTLRAAAERPSSGTRILKTQRADLEGQRRITRATMLR